MPFHMEASDAYFRFRRRNSHPLRVVRVRADRSSGEPSVAAGSNEDLQCRRPEPASVGECAEELYVHLPERRCAFVARHICCSTSDRGPESACFDSCIAREPPCRPSEDDGRCRAAVNSGTDGRADADPKVWSGMAGQQGGRQDCCRPDMASVLERVQHPDEGGRSVGLSPPRGGRLSLPSFPSARIGDAHS
jgi:hypothetical protein